MSIIKDNWQEIKEKIKEEYELSSISYNTWIEPLKYYGESDNTLKILIPYDQAHALNYISKKYKDFFKVTINEMTNQDIDIEFILDNDSNEDTDGDSSISNISPTYNINYANANLNPKYKFDTFVVGSNNKFAHSASLAVAESPGQVYNPLFIYGGPGLGKTHLMHSIGHFILEENSNMKVLYVTSEEFTNEVIDSIRSGNATTLNKLRDKYRTVDVLMVDDVQFIIGKDATQEEFFNTFNALHRAGKQIILSSDKPPKEMETLDERFRSRFEWGLIADIQVPDYETRMAILRKNAENSDINIDDNIIQYIATNVKSNIRELEGALTRIIAMSKSNNDNFLTLEKAQEYLKDIVVPDNNIKITPEIIINAVANEYDISYNDIISTKRNAEIVLPRHIAMYICRRLLEYSLDNVAKVFGKKDHTTIMHGSKKIDDEIKKNPELKEKIDLIIKKINPQNI